MRLRASQERYLVLLIRKEVKMKPAILCIGLILCLVGCSSTSPFFITEPTDTESFSNSDVPPNPPPEPTLEPCSLQSSTDDRAFAGRLHPVSFAATLPTPEPPSADSFPSPRPAGGKLTPEDIGQIKLLGV